MRDRVLLMAIMRHVLTALGGGLVTQGLLSSDELSQGIGSVVTLAGILWSVIEKRQRACLPRPPDPPAAQAGSGER